MQSYKDNYSFSDENAYFEVTVSSALGDREEQQDSACADIKSDEGLVTVCDGMGGHNGGKLASTLATEIISRAYNDCYPNDNMASVVLEAIKNADSKIALLSDENGNRLNAGSTIVSVYIKNRFLHWFSVGDSRIYVFRNGEFVQITSDHTYKSMLDSQLESNTISQEEYNRKIILGEALISFLGLNGFPKIDINETPFELQTNDRIVLMSDGLYKLLDNDVIRRIIDNFSNIKEALQALELKAKKVSKSENIKRDNMTVAVVRIK